MPDADLPRFRRPTARRPPPSRAAAGSRVCCSGTAGPEPATCPKAARPSTAPPSRPPRLGQLPGDAIGCGRSPAAPGRLCQRPTTRSSPDGPTRRPATRPDWLVTERATTPGALPATAKAPTAPGAAQAAATTASTPPEVARPTAAGTGTARAVAGSATTLAGAVPRRPPPATRCSTGPGCSGPSTRRCHRQPCHPRPCVRAPLCTPTRSKDRRPSPRPLARPAPSRFRRRG
jgi:hypothetical protein